ncbi:hypothetical protein RYJ27_07340 [Microbacterium limosum]|uniref:Ig-like domain-containing protein n=1 Tax=Microbacterium limosum TaxID=3079935 RepID=A0ABZ0J9Z1_9MICO|nr:hypothetical protein [Microbacterium sp. Y20]WOQ68547.1 hypothetical protein RYJ27_07340 [Microbacterium sp. Y20]
MLGTFATTVQVSVTGQPLVGETLSATILRGPAPGPDLYEYQWLADGEKLAGATGASLTLTDHLLGKRLSVWCPARG